MLKALNSNNWNLTVSRLSKMVYNKKNKQKKKKQAPLFYSNFFSYTTLILCPKRLLHSNCLKIKGFARSSCQQILCAFNLQCFIALLGQKDWKAFQPPRRLENWQNWHKIKRQ